MVYIERNADGSIKGVYQNLQQGYAEEALPDNDAQVLSFLYHPKNPVPFAVSPRQARLALLAAGLLDQVQAAVDAAGGAAKITWEYATTFDRHDPFITAIGTSLNLTSAQIDALFTQASTL